MPSPIRPGFITHEILTGATPLRVFVRDEDGNRSVLDRGLVAQATPTDLHQEIVLRVRELNDGTRGTGPRARADRLSPQTYHSFVKYLWMAQQLGLLVRVGTEPAIVPAGLVSVRNGVAQESERVLLQLTRDGRRMDRWANVQKDYHDRFGREAEHADSTPPAPARRTRRTAPVTPRPVVSPTPAPLRARRAARVSTKLAPGFITPGEMPPEGSSVVVAELARALPTATPQEIDDFNARIGPWRDIVQAALDALTRRTDPSPDRLAFLRTQRQALNAASTALGKRDVTRAIAALKRAYP